MDEIKKIMLNRGQIFLKKLLASRNVISKFAMPFISDGCVSIIEFIKSARTP